MLPSSFFGVVCFPRRWTASIHSLAGLLQCSQSSIFHNMFCRDFGEVDTCADIIIYPHICLNYKSFSRSDLNKTKQKKVSWTPLYIPNKWMDYKKLNRHTQAESSKGIHSRQLGQTSFNKQFALRHCSPQWWISGSATRWPESFNNQKFIPKTNEMEDKN